MERIREHIDNLESALLKIARGEESVRGMAPQFYGHGMTIALRALGLPDRMWTEEVTREFIKIKATQQRPWQV